jgi:PAT family beta-lactamase induction signal transducer AmpG
LASTPAHNPPWLFSILISPSGFTNGVTSILMPFLLRKYGVPIEQIAGVVAIANTPMIWYFLWSPLADAGLRRRTCIVLSALISGLAGAVAILCVHGSLAWLTVLLFLMNAFTGLLASCCGALLTTLPGYLHGRAAGWYQAGQLGAGAIGGGAVIWLADNVTLPVLALSIAAATMLPTLAAFLIIEPAPVRRPIGAQISGLFHDMRAVLLARRTWIGLMFFLSPVGSAAISNLVSGVGQDYHTSSTVVLWVTGFGSGILSAIGSLIGGMAADRMNRMYGYALAGALAALPAAYLALGPATPWTYGAGYSAYALSTGFAYAVYTALLLDVVGRRKHAAASAYSTLNASGNVPIAYMTWLDGVGYKHWGARGLMGTDAVANGGFAVVLLVVAMFARRYWGKQTAEE